MAERRQRHPRDDRAAGRSRRTGPPRPPARLVDSGMDEFEGSRVSHLWLAVAFGIAALVWITGAATPASIGDNLHLEPIFILVALDRYADLLVQTNALSALARRAVMATRGRKSRISFVFVGFLLLAGAGNNNITTCLLVLPAVLLTLRTVEAGARTTNRVGSLVLAAGNVAGASTPTGDFPARLLVAAGAITYGDYVLVGTPLFVLTALVLAVLYQRLLRDDDHADVTARLEVLDERTGTGEINGPAVRRLVLVFGLMVAAWIAIPASEVSPAWIAWAGLALAGAAIHGTGVEVRLHDVDLRVAVKLTAILLASASLAGTGVVTDFATAATERVSSPLLLLLLMMVITTIVSAVADASGAAAGLLPLLLSLTADGQPLHDGSALAVIAFAAAICAGSSLWTTSATAGQLLEHRLTGARLTDPATGRHIRFTWGSYAPLGAMNCAVQLSVAAVYVVVVANLTGVA